MPEIEAAQMQFPCLRNLSYAYVGTMIEADKLDALVESMTKASKAT